ncbi:hypothetical protein CAPTEDRAFT_172037 [Capitella teleta]|uniref:Uncharacterized protein n=1 Tax=Capitella teleta TaxID=283909 RepID=R7TDC6_CAPTE|nr:hypothetical protein CAPTEDRAFT_172037 [Capitella teleta]|eukprot:ELT91502.1 hypothetical protein CAPTEDRAFT_172037 [Capitella teleta]
MDGHFKKFAADAGTLFNRAKQYTEEKLGHAEKTELDAHFENLLQRADKTRAWTERILRNTEAVLQPNPTARMEEFFYDKLDKKLDRKTNTEFLGDDMINAGQEFGSGTSYGSALIKCGQTEQKLGQAERDFLSSSANNFLQPLKAFLDGDMKTVQKERKILETKRLDLDAAKARLRRAKSQGNKESFNLPLLFPKGEEGHILTVRDRASHSAEADLRVAQAEFDRQAEITKLLLEGISSTHAHHLRCLHDFVEAQQTYYAQCQQYMGDLQRQLGSYGGSGKGAGGSTSPSISNPLYPPTSLPTAPAPDQILNHNDESKRRAKVLYDYDAANMSELTLVADEIIHVENIPGSTDWVMAHRNSQQGKVPITYLEIMN